MAAELTQTALARAVNVHPNEVSYWEKGTRVPQVETVASLAQALDVTPADLLKPEQDGRLTLRQLRVAAGLTQEAAADRASLLPHIYAAVERGSTANPSAAVIGAIAAAFGVSVQQLDAARAASRADYLTSRSTGIRRRTRPTPDD